VPLGQDHRYDRVYRDNLTRYRLERIVTLFQRGREQRLTTIALILGGDRGNVCGFLKRLVDRKFLVHKKRGPYVFPPSRKNEVICIELDWLHSEPKLFFYGQQNGQPLAWWARSDDPGDEVVEWMGSYTEWGAKQFVPREKVEVLSWGFRLGLAMRRVIQWCSRVLRLRGVGRQA